MQLPPVIASCRTRTELVHNAHKSLFGLQIVLKLNQQLELISTLCVLVATHNDLKQSPNIYCAERFLFFSSPAISSNVFAIIFRYVRLYWSCQSVGKQHRNACCAIAQRLPDSFCRHRATLSDSTPENNLQWYSREYARVRLGCVASYEYRNVHYEVEVCFGCK